MLSDILSVLVKGNCCGTEFPLCKILVSLQYLFVALAYLRNGNVFHMLLFDPIKNTYPKRLSGPFVCHCCSPKVFTAAGYDFKFVEGNHTVLFLDISYELQPHNISAENLKALNTCC